MGVLESRLVIRAVDETSAAFASVERRVKALSAEVAMTQRSIGRTPETIAAASSRAVGSASGAVAAANRRSLGGMGSIIGTMSGYAAVIGGGLAVREAVKAVAGRQHEIVRMAVSGMSRAEIADATVEAAKLTGDMPSISMTDTMHMLRNARSIVGSYKEAAEIAEPMMKLRALAQLARPGEDVNEDFDQLIKGLEIKGVTQNRGEFMEYMQGIAKAINVFGDTLKPYQYYEMFKYGRQATPGLSSQFILGTAPTLAQELGGSSYGQAVSSFNKAIVGGVMKHSALKEFARLGLLDHDDLDFLKNGEVKGIKPGRGVKGWQVAQSDPNQWVKDYLLPALDKLGLKDRSDVLKEISTLFQNQVGAQMVGLLATQQARIIKDTDLIKGAPGLEAADRAMREDPALAWQGLKSSIESLTATFGEILGAATDVAGIMTTLAKTIADYNAGILREKELQDQNKPSEDIDATNRKINRFVYGVDTPDAAEAKRKAQRVSDDEAYRDVMDSEVAEYKAIMERLNDPNLSGADRAIAQAHLDRLIESARSRSFRWQSGLPARGIEDLHDAIESVPGGGAGVYPNVMPPPRPRTMTEKQYSEEIGRLTPPQFMPPPTSAESFVKGAIQDANVRVFGEAQVQVEVKATVDASPDLKATIANARQTQTLSVPLSGPTGGMGGDAAPRRGGLATGGSYSP